MGDLNALVILSKQIESFKKVPSPPVVLNDVDAYNKSVTQVLDGAKSAVFKVKSYIEQVEGKIEDLREAQRALIKTNQDAMQKMLAELTPDDDEKADLSKATYKLTKTLSQSPRDPNLLKLQLIHEQQLLSQKIMNDRLNELLRETEEVCAKVKDGAALSDTDMEKLNGCLKHWNVVKGLSFEEEKRRKADMKRKEEEEQKRREREEANRKADAERRQKEEEEKLRIEEMERQKREEEERTKREEEEKKRRVQEEIKRRDEMAARTRAEELRRLERERNRDPSNWKPVIFKREKSCDEVDGKRAYHDGMACIMTSPTGGIVGDDLDCSALDEADILTEIVEDDEKPASSVISIQSTKGTLHSEVPSRIYIPYNSVFDSNDETVVKLSLNLSDWVVVSPVQTTPNIDEQARLVQGMVGIEVNDFNSLKAIVVTRPKCQTIIVDKPGVSVHSTMDKNVKLFVPRNAFGSKTELKLMVQSVSDQSLALLIEDDTVSENVLGVKSLVNLICGKQPRKSIEVDFFKSPQKQRGVTFQHGKSYQLYTSKTNVWTFTDVEVKGHQDDLTVILPPEQDKYTIMELDMASTFPKDKVPEIAEALHACLNKVVVRMIVKQKNIDLTKCTVKIVRREICEYTLAFLTSIGYTEGPDPSMEFSVYEGQQLEISCSGNIEDTTDTEEKKKLTYLSYKGGAATDLTLSVKDQWKQKCRSDFLGKIRCTVLKKDVYTVRTVDLNISLPKQPADAHKAISVARMRFPYYLTTLATYLSRNLCKNNTKDWQAVLRSLLGDSEFGSGHRIAKRKSAENDEEAVCRAMLLDWMKAQAMYEDKLEPILDALRLNGHEGLAKLCVNFARSQKENLSDTVLKELAQDITKGVSTLGKGLGLDKTEIDRCIKDHEGNTTDQYIAVMMEWRESDAVIKHGENALDYLRNLCI